jgi:hypothetical protein
MLLHQLIGKIQTTDFYGSNKQSVVTFDKVN